MELFVGLDVSKSTHDARILSAGKEAHQKISNTKDGFEELWNTLQKRDFSTLYVCLEATGLYWEALAEFLHEKGAIVFVVNARRIKGFAMSEDKRTKTDKVDAGVIARFCRSQFAGLNPWTPPPAEVRKLQALSRQLESLKEDRARQQVRLKSAILCPEVVDSIKHHIDLLDAEIASIERAIKKLVKANQRMQEQHRLATSITGVGFVTAAVVLSECRGFTDFVDRRQVAAFAGLDVSEFVSGSSINRKARLSKRGNSRLRKALYMAALSAIRFNPVIQQLYDRLVLNGKAKMQAIGACMRKLLELMFVVVTSGCPFDPDFAGKQSQRKEAPAAA